jgi:hypothetical protein
MNKTKNRGFLKLRKGIIQNLHPDLKILDETDVPFEGLFHLDLRFFYISYGYNNLEKGVLSSSVKFIVQVIKEYEFDNQKMETPT